jgi:hypothetical protein
MEQGCEKNERSARVYAHVRKRTGAVMDIVPSEPAVAAVVVWTL